MTWPTPTGWRTSDVVNARAYDAALDSIVNHLERKRIAASALAWIDITRGEHRFTPHRHSPGAKPGTTQDRGRSIDRAWWRLRNGKPGHHYGDLRIALAPHIHDVAAAIDSGTMSAN